MPPFFFHLCTLNIVISVEIIDEYLCWLGILYFKKDSYSNGSIVLDKAHVYIGLYM